MKLTSLSTALLLATATAHAQTPPDAGSLQRETGKALRAPTPRPALGAPQAKPMAEDAKALRVTVRSFVIDGASLIPVAELSALIQDLTGQSLTLAELEQAAQRIAQHYRQRGWYVRVYLPVQDVTGGEIRIQVLEGRYGGVQREDKGQRANGPFVEAVATRRLQAGQPLSASDLERGLLLANDLSGIRATGVLEAGEEAGTSRLLLQTDDTPFVTGDLSFNNQGVKSTGVFQLLGGLALNNLSGYGDRLSLRALTAQNLNSLTFQYATPLGSDGWRLGASASAMDYKLGDRFTSLRAEGRATTAGLNLGYAVIRQSDRNLNLSLAAEHRNYEDDALSAALRRQNINALTLGLSGDRNDGLGGGGASWGSLQYTQGRLHIDDVAGDRAADAAGPRTAGKYGKLAFQLARLQSLGSSGWQLQAALNGQWADGNLGSSERFSLGGPAGVRAYPVNEGSGDEGYLLKLELQRDLGAGWQAQAFYDSGSVRQHKNPWRGWQGGSNQPNRYSLAGAGFGISWAGSGDWRLTASVAAALGSNPGATADGKNNDGSKAGDTRYWLSLSKFF